MQRLHASVDLHNQETDGCELLWETRLPPLLTEVKARLSVLHKCLPLLRCCWRPQTASLALTPFEHVVMMQALPRKRVLIINHENVTNCLYTGNQKNMLITNVLFRIGGACAIMSNRHANFPHVHAHTWYKLLRAPRPPSF